MIEDSDDIVAAHAEGTVQRLRPKILYTIRRHRQLRRSQRTDTPLEAIVGAVPARRR